MVENKIEFHTATAVFLFCCGNIDLRVAPILWANDMSSSGAGESPFSFLSCRRISASISYVGVEHCRLSIAASRERYTMKKYMNMNI